VINGIKGHRKVKKIKTGDFLRTYGINELVVNVKKSSFSGMMFTVGRLVRV